MKYYNFQTTECQKRNEIMTDHSSSDNILTNSDEEMTLGGRLYASRQNAGISLHMAANLLGVKSSTLKSWENDRSEPRVNKLVALAGLLGVSPTHFLAEEGNSGKDVFAVKGRRGKLVEMLREEMSYAREQQKQMNQIIRKMDVLIQKL
jgi:transcriptional regulator with XRE-family HTH domain